jgi:hypothetical protein
MGDISKGGGQHTLARQTSIQKNIGSEHNYEAYILGTVYRGLSAYSVAHLSVIFPVMCNKKFGLLAFKTFSKILIDRYHTHNSSVIP